MAQFTLTWDNTDVAANPNATGQVAAWSVAGQDNWDTSGFTPDPLTVNDKMAVSPNLADNIVYDFLVFANCSDGGGAVNDNGIQQAINFACLYPSFVTTQTASTITIDVTGLSITKARITLRKASDNSAVYGPTIVMKVVDTISVSVGGLTAGTNYYWQVELYAVANNVELKSDICSPYPITTDAAPVCAPVTSFTVSSIEIP